MKGSNESHKMPVTLVYDWIATSVSCCLTRLYLGSVNILEDLNGLELLNTFLYAQEAGLWLTFLFISKTCILLVL